MKLLVIMELSNKKSSDKLKPLTMIDKIEKIIVLRRYKNPIIEKVECITPSRYFQVNPLLLVIWKFFQGIQIIKKEKIDVIVSYYFFPHNIIAVGLSLLFKKPVMASFIGTDVNSWFEKRIFGKIFISISTRNSQIFVTGTQSNLRLLQKGISKRKIKILPNSIDIGKMNYLEVDRTIDLIFVGSLKPIKRVGIIIEILHEISKKINNIKLVVLGSGSEEQELRKTVQRHGLNSNVEFIGQTSDVGYWLRRSKILLLTSRNEGRPAVIMEAMIFGTVPVVLDVGDISDICQTGIDSILIEDKGDFKAQFVEQIISLLKKKEIWAYLSKNAKNRKQDFSYISTASVWKKSFKQV